MEIDYKIFMGAIAVGMTIWAHIPYFVKTIKGTNKPHIFTWIIWTLLTCIAAAAQFTGGAGPGAWVTAATGLICIAITCAAFFNGERRITRSDRYMFIAALSAIPVWMIMDNPLLAVIIVTLIDVSAIYPTFRKSWSRPHEEDTFMYGFNIPRHLCSITAINAYSSITVIYPAGLFVMNVMMYVMLKWRRRILGKESAL